MALILNIETATKICSVALAKDGKLISFREQGGQYSHAELITTFIQEVIAEASIELKDLDAVAISKKECSIFITCKDKTIEFDLSSMQIVKD